MVGSPRNAARPGRPGRRLGWALAAGAVVAGALVVWLLADPQATSEVRPSADGAPVADLGDNALVDLRALADLPALTVLNLDRTGADLWPLARLTGLRRLSLRGAGLGDVEALRGLTGLRVLDIGANRVEDLAPLGGLSALEALRADGNAVRDASALRASALRAMEGLRILDLDLDGDAAAGRSP